MLLFGAVLCSCSLGRSRYGSVVPVSETAIFLMESNTLPLEPFSLTRDSSGVKARYRFISHNCLCTSDARLLCQGTATLNGTALLLAGGTFPVSGLVREGENVIEVCGTEEMGPVSLVGEFGVWASAQGEWFTDQACAPELGLLSRQGYPFYAGEVTYQRLFEVPEKVGKRILRIPSWKGTSCSVWVNDRMVADVKAHHVKMNVGPYLKPGENEVTVVLSGSSGEIGFMKEPTIE